MLTLPWPNQELRIDVTHDREEALRRLQESCDATHEFMTSVHLAGADEPMTAPTRVMATALCEHVETNYDVGDVSGLLSGVGTAYQWYDFLKWCDDQRRREHRSSHVIDVRCRSHR